MADLSVKFAGLKFKNPIIASSGPPTRNLACVKKAINAGVGAVVPKTINFEEFSQTRPHPIYYRTSWKTLDAKSYQERIPKDASLVARDVLCSYSPEKYMRVIREMKKITKEEDVILIGSVMGRTVDEWVELSKMMDKNGVDMIELNLSCQSTALWSLALEKGVLEVGQSPDAVQKVVRAVKKAVSVPVLAKLSFQMNNPSEISKCVKEAGGDGVTMFNILHGLMIDVETLTPVNAVHFASGVFSGMWIKPLVLRWIAKTAKEVGIPISGSWGIQTWKDILEYIMAGAGTVQFCSAIMAVGYPVINDMLLSLNKFMDDKGYKSIDSLIGCVLDKIVPSYKDYDKVQPVLTAVVDESRCNVCGRCLRICFYDAIILEKDSAKVIRDRCIGCTGCKFICPEGAILMEQGDESTYLRALTLEI
jgi:dihydroorotate dehydrogenase subfamily 1